MRCTLPPQGLAFALFALFFLAALGVSAPSAHAIEIEIRYDYDTRGFFNAPERRSALRAVCDFYEAVFTDSLAAIIPSGSNTWTPEFNHPGTGGNATLPGNPSIPANTILLFAGGRPLTGNDVGVGGFGGYNPASGNNAWFDLLDYRGQSQSSTNFVLWGGSVSFDEDRLWNFSTTSSGNGTDFVPVALHEIAHVFGFGIASAFNSQIVSGTFRGSNAVAAFGGFVPIQGGGGHWAQTVDSATLPMFSTSGGIDQTTLMAPTLIEIGGALNVLTEVDLAAFEDIGWLVTPPSSLVAPEITVSVNPANGHVTLCWPSLSGSNYQVQESTLATGWSNFGALISGTGNTLCVTDNTPPPGRNFYRIVTSLPAPPPPPPAPQASPRSAPVEENETVPTFQFTKRGRSCNGCGRTH